MNQTVRKIGLMKVAGRHNRLTVYESLIEKACATCAGKIVVGDSCTRVGNGIAGRERFNCERCRAITLDEEKHHKTPLSCYIDSQEWFDKANGNAVELMESIAKAAGYSGLERTRSFASMVGYHLKQYDRLLAANFFCLLSQAADKFPVIRSEAGETFNAMFGQ